MLGDNRVGGRDGVPVRCRVQSEFPGVHEPVAGWDTAVHRGRATGPGGADRSTRCSRLGGRIQDTGAFRHGAVRGVWRGRDQCVGAGSLELCGARGGGVARRPWRLSYTGVHSARADGEVPADAARAQVLWPWEPRWSTEILGYCWPFFSIFLG